MFVTSDRKVVARESSMSNTKRTATTTEKTTKGEEKPRSIRLTRPPVQSQNVWVSAVPRAS